MTRTSDSPGTLGRLLAKDAYLRERLKPRWRDMNHLVCRDLLAVIREYAAEIPVGAELLDYGSGGSPYESLFANCARYVRADIVPGPKVQLQLRPDGLTDESTGSYDAILSTQVLEHVPDPLGYLVECERLLRPGGTALITTHGMFEEHGCPHDYHRWTSTGLERLAGLAGLEVVRSLKLTTHLRGAAQMFQYLVETLRLPGRRGPVGVFLDLVRRCHRNLTRPLVNWVGDQFPAQGVVPASDPVTVYVGIAVVLRKRTGADSKAPTTERRPAGQR